MAIRPGFRIKQPLGGAMSLLTQAQSAQLLANGCALAEDRSFDPLPVAKLFLPDAKVCWVLGWIDPDTPDIAFGLCDTGLGLACVTPIELSALQTIQGPQGCRVVADHSFVPRYTLAKYVSQARRDGHVID